MKTIYISFILITIWLLSINSSFAQSIFFKFDELHKIQLKYQSKQVDPNQYGDSLLCEKLYNIPDSVILKNYPYDADSIYVAIPDSSKDTSDNVFCGYNKIDRYPIIAKMTKDELLEFTDNIYNYDCVGNYSIFYSSVEKNDPPRYDVHQHSDTISGLILSTTSFAKKEPTLPNIILLFYHKNIINYIGIYFDDDENQVRMATSFTEPTMLYLGEYCLDRNLRLRNYFQSRYNIKITKFEDYIPPLLPLIENF